MDNIARARHWLTGVGSLTRFDDRATSLAHMLDEAERRGAKAALEKAADDAHENMDHATRDLLDKRVAELEQR